MKSFVLFCLILLCSSIEAQQQQDNKHIEVALRMIGHQVLLNAQDSTSRVLPIIKTNNQYIIQFESEFAFEPEMLAVTVDSFAKKTQLADSYILEVEQCETDAIVYSFEVSVLDQNNIQPCQSRSLDKSCYNLIFTLSSPIESDSSSLLSKSGFIQGSSNKIGKTGILFASFILLSLAGIILLMRNRKEKPATIGHLVSLGDYKFDKKNTELIKDSKRIELTSKEADLLILLYDAVNTTIERDVILRKVWGDEGDYVGRTLDVFISKLRKKLKADPKVKIVNIRGVGYKLVTNA